MESDVCRFVSKVSIVSPKRKAAKEYQEGACGDIIRYDFFGLAL